jgi:carboxyl-terminal processing protease
MPLHGGDAVTRRVAVIAAFAAIPLVAGGFVLQRQQERNSARLFAQVFSRVASEAVDSLSTDAMYEKAARGLVDNLGDPYADLYSPQELASFNRNTLGNAYGGVGMLIEDQQGIFTVSKIFPHTPAEGGGVQLGDRILQVDGWSTRGAKLEEVSARLTGRPGTNVAVRFQRYGVEGPIESRFTRATVHVPAVPYAVMVDGNIGYVPVQRFNDTAGEEVERAVTALRKDGARAFILDLRGNGGGSFEQSLFMANLFLPKGAEIVSVRTRQEPPQVSRALNEPLLQGVPLVVLTDGYTASASEIVAGALQDHDRALVVGTTSFGKGLVQTLFGLEGGWALKMTTGKWYTPAGRSIQRERRPDDNGRLVEVVPDSMETDSVRRSRPTFKSDGGRVVYGGGGITPDMIVPADTITTAESDFLRAAAPKSQQTNIAIGDLALSLKQSARADFRASQATRDSLYARLQRSQVPVTRAQFDAARPLLDRMVESRVSAMAFGDSAAFRRSLAWDSQLRRAIGVLSGATNQRDLLAKAGQQLRPGA